MQSSLVNNQSSSSASSLSSLIRFSLGEIERATNNFADELSKSGIYGRGLYRGNISRNNYNGEVLVLRLQLSHSDATLMLENEIKVLSVCHHVNIISLVGFCDENDERILVYDELIPDCALNHYLHYKPIDDQPPRLTVEQLLEICLGVAKGLCYLHDVTTGFTVVHGMINSENIFLDASLIPMITGFGYARTSVAGPSSSQEIITNRTQVLPVANILYSPPEGHEQGYKPSEKGDVYAFAILFLEVLCRRHPWDKLLVLALPFIMKGELPKFTPEHVKKNITPACARRCQKLIMSCLEFEPDKRPCMNLVVQDLELALKLQKDQHIIIEEQSSDVSNRCQSFKLVEIKSATNELSNTLGEGSFGKVYHGNISNNGNNVDVAVKFMNTDPERGIPAFELEKQLLSACDHVNIISLVGFCDEGAEKILVYEFMPNGSLYDYLYKPKDGTPCLTVDQRLEICLGVAKGLHYLHSRNDYNIIHSDLKTDNILLDAYLVPKISDFGLSRTRVVGPSTSSIITNKIQGTDGYIAPECYEPNYKLSRKADVYAFGVILLEVLCEKPAWERLVIWGLPFVSKGELPKFTPEHVVKNMSPECSRACVNLIRDCLDNDPNIRPCMSHVISNLDLALTLQKMYVDGKGTKNKSQANSLQRFSLSDIETATNKFTHQLLFGETEGQGEWADKVYRGNISVDVAVKRIGYPRGTIIDEFAYEQFFDNEIALLSACHHTNIISLLGYCDEPENKILIYEFMPNGLLYDCLYSKQDSANHLTVEQRLEICLGVAKGLSYLHSSNFIHGDLNSRNILLDRNFVAKITNFKYSRNCLPGSFYLLVGRVHHAPEIGLYDGTSQEGDVYAFGVLFLEVLCERSFKSNLIASAHTCIIRRELATFTPKHVRTYITRKCTQACENFLMDCLENEPDKRPSMNQVVEKLELALKLQKEGANY